MISGAFFNKDRKNNKNSVQIIEKWQGNGRTSREAINLSEAVLGRKRETEWMLKLRTVYPYGLHENVDIAKMIKM